MTDSVLKFGLVQFFYPIWVQPDPTSLALKVIISKTGLYQSID